VTAPQTGIIVTSSVAETAPPPIAGALNAWAEDPPTLPVGVPYYPFHHTSKTGSRGN
jgi:hypothetical protein